jgi:hypothetical protein
LTSLWIFFVTRSKKWQRRFVLAAMWAISSVGLQTPQVLGASWVRLDFNFLLTFITADPKASQTLYVGAVGSGQGLYKTIDGGNTWKELRRNNEPLVVSKLRVSFQTSSTLYAMSLREVIKSVDGGETWQSTGPGLTGMLSSLAIDPQNDDIVYVGGSCNTFACRPSVFKTVNGGASWTPSTNTLWNPACIWSVNDIAVDPKDSSKLYATTSDCIDWGGYLWKSVDGGISWSARENTGNLFLNVSYYSPIVIDPQSPNVLYAGTFEFGVSKSLNGGETWVNASSGLPPVFPVGRLAIDPQFPERLYAASALQRAIYRSLNGGASWTAVSDGLGTQGVYGLAITSGYPKTVFALTYDGLFKLVEDVDSPNTGDIDGDGKSDILWRNGDLDPVAWLMNGSTVTGNSLLPFTRGWSTSGLGDFDGDGRDDILRRSSSGDVEVWLMDGVRIASSNTLGNVWPGWTVSGVGDFDDDGRDDILWRSVSGDVAIWLMDGGRLASFHPLGNIWTGWTISGVGDFNGDNRADILWRSASGEVAIWLMDGGRLASFHSLGNVSTGWTISAVGDFNGDDRADILWRSVSGEVAIWLMDDGTVASSRIVANIWTGWSITGTGDFDGDGRTDILWQEATGSVVMWRMDGFNVIADSRVGP